MRGRGERSRSNSFLVDGRAKGGERRDILRRKTGDKNIIGRNGISWSICYGPGAHNLSAIPRKNVTRLETLLQFRNETRLGDHSRPRYSLVAREHCPLLRPFPFPHCRLFIPSSSHLSSAAHLRSRESETN